MATGFTVADVLAWARTKPAGQAYNYCDAQNCAVAQFGRETGRQHLIGLLSGQLDELVPGLRDAVNTPFGGMTFGALVVRLEAMVPVSSKWTKADAYLTDIEQVDA